MKNIKSIITCLAVVLLTSGCLQEYLDKAPEADLTEKEVFSKYANFKSYFYAV